MCTRTKILARIPWFDDSVPTTKSDILTQLQYHTSTATRRLHPTDVALLRKRGRYVSQSAPTDGWRPAWFTD